MAKPIGIDLGTTFSAVAVVEETGRPRVLPNSAGQFVTPSYVFYKGPDEVVVGQAAKAVAAAKEESVVKYVKRHMSEPDWKFEDAQGMKHSPEEISALILKKLKQDAEAALGEKINEAVITVPAYFGDLERKRTSTAGELAGLSVLRLVNEPTAAALAYGLERVGGKGLVLVYDLGGGTFDVTVLAIKGAEIEVVATDGHRTLGGVDFDVDLCHHFISKFQEEHGLDPTTDTYVYQEFLSKAEAAKITLSDLTETYVALSAAGKTTQVELTRDAFEALIRPRLDTTFDLTKEVLEQASEKLGQPLTWKDIDTLLLVGGSTRIPLVRRMVQEITGKQAQKGINPDEIVAVGASIVAAQETGIQIVDKNLDPMKAFEFKDVTSHSLGTITTDHKTREHYNEIIVPKNTTIPFDETKGFTTVEDDQTDVRFEVTMGEERDPKYCQILGEVIIRDLPPMPQGEPSLKCTFRYDKEGKLEVLVKEQKSGREKRGTLEIAGILSREERLVAQRRVTDITVK